MDSPISFGGMVISAIAQSNSMDPVIGHLALNLGMVILVLALISLPFVNRDSPEFLIAIFGIVLSGGFIAIVSYEIRREARLATKE